jgi:hypothetical protein
LLWQGLRKENMLKSKWTISTHDLFYKLLIEFCAFLEHCHSLSFDGKPNYNYFLALFDNLLSREEFQGNITFNWDVTDVADKKIMRQGRKSGIHKHGHSPSVKCCTG